MAYFFITETKIDNTFPTSQFIIKGYTKPFRIDRNDKGGGIILFIREDIPCKELKSTDMNNIEGLFVELNLRNKKWLLFGGYNPHKTLASVFFEKIIKNLDQFISQYDNIILLGDFNIEPQDKTLIGFCDSCNVKNLVKEPTCF